MLGSLKGQDGGKAILLAALVLGTVLATFRMAAVDALFYPLGGRDDFS